MTTSNLRRTAQLGADFWNDSCDLRELGEAVVHGAVGATSNPVIVHQAVQSARDTWLPVLDDLVRGHPTASEDELAWMLVERMGERAAALLAPVHAATAGLKGFLSMQVNPQLYRSSDRMQAHAERLAAVAPNVAIKIPATGPGLSVIEQLTARGVRVNATVCFTLPQAMACAEAMERGLDAAARGGRDPQAVRPYVTIMVGRLDDHLRRAQDAQGISIDPGWVHWAGVAVFKKAWRRFHERGFRSTLLAAAYRHVLHWSELIGEDVVLTMPYKWWKQFEAAELTPRRSIEEPVEPRIVEGLYERFADFRRAWDEDGLAPDEFARYGASVHTLQQFLGGYQGLLELVRGRMLA
jgi:transaldolase